MCVHAFSISAPLDVLKGQDRINILTLPSIDISFFLSVQFSLLSHFFCLFFATGSQQELNKVWLQVLPLFLYACFLLGSYLSYLIIASSSLPVSNRLQRDSPSISLVLGRLQSFFSHTLGQSLPTSLARDGDTIPFYVNSLIDGFNCLWLKQEPYVPMNELHSRDTHLYFSQGCTEITFSESFSAPPLSSLHLPSPSPLLKAAQLLFPL